MTAAWIYCSVRGCQRRSSAETMARRGWDAFVCGSHWRRATLREKALIQRFKRRQRRIMAMTGEYDQAIGRREWVAWQAIERRLAGRPPVAPRR